LSGFERSRSQFPSQALHFSALNTERAMVQNSKYVNPYVERGKRAEETKKVTVTIPTHVLKLVIDERTRRQIKSLRHATISELLVEAFLHAFTGQPLPTDEELARED
jgi:MetJ family transcriptional regulator, methionine regulon repressor